MKNYNEDTPRSPLGPLGKMGDGFEELNSIMFSIKDLMERMNRGYYDLKELREMADSNAHEVAAYLRSVLDEQAQLIDENKTLQAQLASLSGEKDLLQKRIEDLERQLEARKFNPELRAQNDKLLAENEEMKRKRKKDMEARVAETRSGIFDTLRAALEERDQLVACYGNPSEWVHTLDLMRAMFRKLPELTQHIDNLMAQHLNEPKPTEKPTVTNIINQDIHDNEKIII